jgi:hypothetical protein
VTLRQARNALQRFRGNLIISIQHYLAVLPWPVAEYE